MPTIKQLPAATAVSGSDLVPLSQNGLTRSTTVTTLLSNTQPLLSMAQGTLLGRVSASPGGPEAVSVGTGLSQQGGTIASSGTDHVNFALSTALLSDDEVVINSQQAPKRIVATKLRSLFSAGPGVQIDAGGVISITAAPSSGTGASGAKGDTGAQGSAGQGFTFRGAWQANIAYSAYDVVTNGGQTYVAVIDILAAATFVALSWTLIAAQGSVGATGATGSVGPSGPNLAAAAGNIGAVKPGAGLSVASDGTLSISNVSLSAIAQGNAAIGQLLGWSGTGWSPTTPAPGVAYTGAAPINISSGVISLSQTNATSGQVLTWNGSTWVPQAPASSGVVIGVAIPLSDGIASAGSASAASREDHRHSTDTSRAPLANPSFSGSITLPTWTTATRPVSPTPGMEGFATDTSRRETYTSAGWVQYVRTIDIPAASGQLLGGSITAGVAASVSIGSGLTLVGGTLSASATPTVVAISGVSVDGSLIVASAAAPYQMNAVDRVVDVNKVNGAPTKILLPQNPTLWVDYNIIDGKGDTSANNITLALAQGGTINGQSSFVMTANNDAITLRAINSTVWRIV